MTKSVLERIIKDMKQVEHTVDVLYDNKINVIDSDFYLNYAYLFEVAIEHAFTPEISDFIKWWIWENDFGRKGYAYDNQEFPSFDKAWEYVKTGVVS